MKKSIMLTILALSIPINTLATDGGNTNNEKDDIPLIKKTPPPTRGPRKPSNQMIWFSYNSATQQCEFSLLTDIEYISVTIEQLPVGFYYTDEVSSSCTTISVAIPSGYYRITGTTEDGATYIGEGHVN